MMSRTGLSDAELAPYLLTETPTRDTFYRVTGLVPGTTYFFHVRSVRIVDEAVEKSIQSNEVDMSPRIQFTRPDVRELSSGVERIVGER